MHAKRCHVPVVVVSEPSGTHNMTRQNGRDHSACNDAWKQMLMLAACRLSWMGEITMQWTPSHA